jgi:thiamine biosynthesis lipoprotein ApbE
MQVRSASSGSTIVAALVAAAVLVAAAPSRRAAPSISVAGRAFGAEVAIDIRDLARGPAEEAARQALHEVAELERLTDPSQAESALARLNAAAGKGPQAIDPRLAAALRRALGYCLWSDRRHGPLAGPLYALRPGRDETGGDPFDQAAALTGCERLRVDDDKHTAVLAAGSRLDLIGFAAGLAVDRAVEVLGEHGVRNAQVRIGRIWHAIGGGSEDQGWWVELPAFPGSEASPERILLKDQAMAAILRNDPPLSSASPAPPFYLDGRSGRAATPLAVVTVTALAADALPLAVTLLLAGSRQGELLLGSVNPHPAVLWIEGSGGGEPLFVPYHWAEVRRRPAGGGPR